MLIKGSVTYDFDQDAVSINIGDPKNFISIAHELKHAYQFEVGELSFGSNGKGGLLYNLEDEITAYNRGVAYGGNPYEYGTYSELERKKIFITHIKDYLSYKQFQNINNKNHDKNIFRYENKTYK